ncbi:MAG: hypothetical protein QOF11_2801 [Chloroflexota bacterium]|jgi:hypothetical protein|nr:hypothetical protein [Chloroflexota bacterium]
MAMLPGQTVRSLAVVTGAAFLVVAACGASVTPRPSSTGSSPAGPGASPSATPSAPSPTLPPASAPPSLPPASGEPAEPLTETLDRSTFNDPTTIDNAWSPMPAGTQLVLEGKANTDEGRVSRKVTFTITDLTKVIDGVRSVVVYEQDYTAGELEESELSFYAQDDGGTVWLMGEYPEEYDGGKFDKAPTWISGFKDASAGILMKAAPTLGERSYAEGWGPQVGWNDRAKIFEMSSKTCVPTGCYDDVLVIDEFNPDEPDAHQLKYYARGVGTVRVGWAGALEEEQEALQLTRFVHLDAGLMAKVRASAIALDKHGYQVSKDVYANTPPIASPSSY